MSNAKDPLPLRRGPGTELEARAGRLLEAADVAEPWRAEDRQESWRRIAARADEPSRRGARWVGVAVAALLLVTALLARRELLSKGDLAPSVVPAIAAAPAKLHEPPALLKQIDLGSLGTIEVGDGTVYELSPAVASAGPTLRLKAGRLCATIRHRDPAREGPFTLVAPKLRIIDVGTRFCVVATASRTAVDVTEGEVRVEGDDWSRRVVAGQSLASDDPRPSPVPAVGAPAPSSSSCEALRSLDAREACEAAASAGDGLAAQNALYNLALLARDQRHDGASALSLFQAYRHRFPQGPLAPEASLGILTELSQEGRYAEAAEEATQYLAAYPGEAKAAQVGLILGNLQRERLANPAAARSAYERVLAAAAEPEVAGEALFGLAASELQLGDRSGAHAAARRYLAEHPTGARAAEAARLLER